MDAVSAAVSAQGSADEARAAVSRVDLRGANWSVALALAEWACALGVSGNPSNTEPSRRGLVM